MAIERIPHNDSDLPQPGHSTSGESAGAGQDVILVIDDDTEVLSSVRRLLIREGWVVLTASDPLEGLRVYEVLWQEIQLVLLDYFMPILRGDEVLERLQRINPHVRVLLTTACDDGVSQKMLQGGLCGFVQKALSPRDLIGGIHNALNHHDPTCPGTLQPEPAIQQTRCVRGSPAPSSGLLVAAAVPASHHKGHTDVQYTRST